MKTHVTFWVLLTCVFLSSTGCTRRDSQRSGTHEQSEKTSGTVSVKNAELHYVVEGGGIPCIVLGHSLSQRRILSQELRDHFRFVFADLRHDAQSSSSMPISEITLNTYLDDIAAIIDTLEITKTAIFAHSHHAFIAIEYARKYPAQVSHVIIAGCTPRAAEGAGNDFWERDASDERKMIFDRNWEGLPRDKLNQMSPKERFVATYVAMTPKLLYDPRADLSYIVNVIDNDKDVFLHLQLSILNSYDIVDGPTISTPVFLAVGRYDYVAPYLLWDDRKSVLLNLSYNLFTRSAHFPMVEERELFDKKLVEWISSH